VSLATQRKVHLFFRDEYVYDILEAGMRHTFDVLRSRRERDALCEIYERSLTPAAH
jgi:hypothetical protein